MGFSLKNQYEAKIIYTVIAIIAFVEGKSTLFHIMWMNEYILFRIASAGKISLSVLFQR